MPDTVNPFDIKVEKILNPTVIKLAEPEIELWFTGYYLVEESNELSDSDEPYAFITAIVGAGEVVPTKIEERELDAGDRVEEWRLLYRGRAQDIVISVMLMESDHGSPAQIQENFVKKVTALAKGVPVFGGVAEWVADGVADFFGLADDLIEHRTKLVPTSEIRHHAANKGPAWWSPEADFIWKMGSEKQGIYNVHFLVRPAP
jgi:hypothetical protein